MLKVGDIGECARRYMVSETVHKAVKNSRCHYIENQA